MMLALSYSQRGLHAIEGKPQMDQLDILRMYVEQGEADGDLVSVDELNVLRRKFICIASDLYRGRIPCRT